MKEKKKAPFYLLIHTNSYTGNFERELVAYCIGKLDEEQEGHSREFAKAFWNKVVGSDIDSLEDYKYMNENYKPVVDEATFLLNKLESILEKHQDIEGLCDLTEDETSKKFKDNLYNENIERIYDKYLCYTYQDVDDWEQDTFYNICSFYKNDKYNCDTIYIQLNEPLSEYFENIIIERIKEFFENDIYNIITNYQWVCHFGEGRKSKEEYKLLDLELVDKDDNLIKKYV